MAIPRGIPTRCCRTVDDEIDQSHTARSNHSNSGPADDLGTTDRLEMDEQGEYAVKSPSGASVVGTLHFRKRVLTHIRGEISQKEELLASELTQPRDELGHVPHLRSAKTQRDHDRPKHPSVWVARKQAVKAAGLEYRGLRADQIIRTGRAATGTFRYGPNWYKQRKRALGRDDFECQMPGCTIDRGAGPRTLGP